ncbi:MAG: hypothetical protein LQ338_000440 [Usnochroma carphineum]|nr:MAG: hypothetical protein LQ338_000440 [Usnochroma carphineum]
MAPQHPGRALPPMRCNGLIEHVLQHHKAPTTVIVCSSREAFLESLQSSLEADNANEDIAMTGTMDASPHPLLVPTIHQLATSKTVDIAFAPTLPHLRAYLASYAPTKASKYMSAALAKSRSRCQMLAIYGMLKLQRTTTEHSVQGLSRTLAVAAEAADYWGMRLTLVEAPEDSEPPAAELNVEIETAAPQDPWAAQVPLLNSSLALSNDRVLAGRTVDAGAVISRWCKIVRG